jgi:putative Ca2+/H+ antiporter (TMEM165/GDT1 family)
MLSLGVIATVFALVAVAELPDKTMIATLIMGSRSRPLWIWIGASAAFTLHVALAVGAGRLLELLPHRTLEIVVTILFLAGAVYLLAIPEKAEEEKGERQARAEGRGAAFKVIATAFGVILIGEFGDLTQLLIVSLVGRTHQPWSVFIGALLALIAAAALGAFGGRALLRYLPLTVIRRVGGVILLGFAGYSIYSLVR